MLELLESRLVPSAYYVDNTNPLCSDTGPGSALQPFCHIQAGANRAIAGDSVSVVKGIYSEMVTVTHSGTASAPIVFTTLSRAGVVVTGQTNGFNLSGVSWVTVQGFTITRTAAEGISVSNSAHITIDSNDVSFAGQPASGLTARGIYLNATNNSTVSRNTTHNNSSDGILLEGGSTGNDVVANNSYGNAKVYIRDANGIQLYGASGNTVERNLSHDNEDTGINVYAGSNNNLFFDNVAYNSAGDHGFDFNNSSGNVVIDNSVYHNVTAGINVEGTSTGTTLVNNISVDNGINSPRTAGNIRVDSASLSGTAINFDVVFLTVPGQVMIVWGSNSYTSLSAFVAATGQERRGIQADPLWVAAASGNFHLLEGSPAIDSANSGVSGQPAYDADGNHRVDDPLTPNTGVGPRTYDDRGAYEYQVGTAPISAAMFPLSNGSPSFTQPGPGAYQAGGAQQPGGTQINASLVDSAAGSTGLISNVNPDTGHNSAGSGPLSVAGHRAGVKDLGTTGSGGMGAGVVGMASDVFANFGFPSVGP